MKIYSMIRKFAFQYLFRHQRTFSSSINLFKKNFLFIEDWSNELKDSFSPSPPLTLSHRIWIFSSVHPEKKASGSDFSSCHSMLQRSICHCFFFSLVEDKFNQKESWKIPMIPFLSIWWKLNEWLVKRVDWHLLLERCRLTCQWRISFHIRSD